MTEKTITIPIDEYTHLKECKEELSSIKEDLQTLLGGETA